MSDGGQKRIEFGDFQTPELLCNEICLLLAGLGISPASILEPTCGRGSFLKAALEQFPEASNAVGLDINTKYVEEARRSIKSGAVTRVEVLNGDFFAVQWNIILRSLRDPLLVIGNPPWITNAAMRSIAGSNLPPKSNFLNHSGLDAITGKSNFDISEWMLLREFEWLDGRSAVLAMLCKTSVARKVLLHAWKKSLQLARSDIYRIDAVNSFGAVVDACLLVCRFDSGQRSKKCFFHENFEDAVQAKAFGFADGRLIADFYLYERHKDLAGELKGYKWRSGIKHDCVEIMELTRKGSFYSNGIGEQIELEEEHVYPMVKSSCLARGSGQPDRWMLVTQRYVNQDTASIRRTPKTWDYLQRHAGRFRKRASAIYKNRPDFSIFGVGDYSFSPWKVAIPALYKKSEFKVVPPFEGRPVVFDDTCYFLPCKTQSEAELLCEMLNSAPAQEFYAALVFWDAKRPITAEVLCQLNLHALSLKLGIEGNYGPRIIQDVLTFRNSENKQ